MHRVPLAHMAVFRQARLEPGTSCLELSALPTGYMIINGLCLVSIVFTLYKNEKSLHLKYIYSLKKMMKTT